MDQETTTQTETVEQVEAPAVSTDTPAEASVTFDNMFDYLDETEASETVVAPEAAPIPSATVEAKSDTPASVEDPPPAIEEPDEEPDLQEVLQAKNGTPSLSRKQLREVEGTLLTPFRDPDSPIEDVISALRDFHPTRTDELFQAVVNDAAYSQPDAWIQALTGIEGLTVEGVKALKEAADKPPQQERSAEESIEARLSEAYGDDWRDPANDDLLLEEDRLAAVAAREVSHYRKMVEEGDSAKQTKLDQALKEIEELKGQSDQFKKHQEALFEKDRVETFTSLIDEYKSSVEQAVLPPLIDELGLKVSETDTDVVKHTKQFMQWMFEEQNDEGSIFGSYLARQYSGREVFGKAVANVTSLIEQASDRTARSKVAPKDEAARLTREAQSLRAAAERDKAAISVMTKNAAVEFLNQPQIAAPMKLLELISQQERQAATTGRKEIIGNTVTAGSPDAWKEALKDDPWGKLGDVLGDQLAAVR